MEGVWSKNEFEIKIFMSRWGLALRTQGINGSLCDSEEKHYDDKIRDAPWRTTRTAEERRFQSNTHQTKGAKPWFMSGS